MFTAFFLKKKDDNKQMRLFMLESKCIFYILSEGII